jgi:hypothetical protein
MKLVLRETDKPDVLVCKFCLLAECDNEIRRALLTSLAVLEHPQGWVRQTFAVVADL